MSNEPASNATEQPIERRRWLRLKPVPPATMRHALGSLGVSLAAGTMFLWLSSQVMTSTWIVAMDTAAFDLARGLHTPWLTTIVTWITRIGNTSTLTVLSIAVGFWLARIGSRRRLIAFVGSSRVDLQACKLEYSIVSPK